MWLKDACVKARYAQNVLVSSALACFIETRKWAEKRNAKFACVGKFRRTTKIMLRKEKRIAGDIRRLILSRFSSTTSSIIRITESKK